ncbi:MAG: tRNA pseudouridine(38-40) synthase TruA [Bacillota bacterium]|nr:tRNA pseudouridine(38-40) synthase TruA [Bacillota bacterium]
MSDLACKVRGLPPEFLVPEAELLPELRRLVVPSSESRDRGRAAPGQRRLALLLAFDGTDWAGWQLQENARSIQGELEAAWRRVTGSPIRLTGCSRTDAGVHARCHLSHFDSAARIPLERIPLALNAQLPPSITVRAAYEVAPDFHARFDCIEKTYAYQIWNGPKPSPFEGRWLATEPLPLDTADMRLALPCLLGTHDFTSFRAAGSETKTSVRTLTAARLEVEARPDGRLLRLIVTGSGFLYNMMRIIAGTLVAVGRGELEPLAVATIMHARDRRLAGKTMPPGGLILERIRYRSPAADNGG